MKEERREAEQHVQYMDTYTVHVYVTVQCTMYYTMSCNDNVLTPDKTMSHDHTHVCVYVQVRIEEAVTHFHWRIDCEWLASSEVW